MKCQICGLEKSTVLRREFTVNNIFSHVGRKHGITKKEYYDKYLKKENDGFCLYCGEKTHFMANQRGYSSFCNASHQTKWVMKNNKDYKENFINAGRKYWLTEEGKKEKSRISSASRKKFWSDPKRKQKTVAKMAKAIQAKWDNDPIYRLAHSERGRKCWQNDEYRKKVCESQSIGAARRIARVGNGHNDRNYKTGQYFSVKSDKNVYYASSYEKQAFEKLENDDNVSSYDRAKVAIKYVRPDDHRMHRYVPDILAELKDGKKMLIEIKPNSMLNDEIVKSKISAAQLYCRKKNYEYTVWSEKDLQDGSQ
jgi:hypothetical protein